VQAPRVTVFQRTPAPTKRQRPRVAGLREVEQHLRCGDVEVSGFSAWDCVHGNCLIVAWPAFGARRSPLEPRRAQHYLILTFQDMTRCYIGPDQTTVQRRAELVAAALARRLGPIQAAQVGAWVEWAWEALLDELVDAISTDLKELRP
jgi:hypothetical protein